MVSLTIKALIKALSFILIIAGLLAGSAILNMNNFFRPSHSERESEIYISSSRNFRRIAISGDGTPENPYIIDSLNVSTTKMYGMYIRSIEGLYVIIQNCIFETSYVGLYIVSFFGDLIIRNNTFVSDFRIIGSSNISIYNNSGGGLDVDSSWNISISKNCFKDGWFIIHHSEQINVTRNIFSNCSLYLFDTKNSSLTYNCFEYSRNSAGYLLEFSFSNNNTIFSNNFTNSQYLAMNINGEYNTFYHNNFISSWLSLGPAGFENPHVEDNGENNLFYSTTLSEGNFWDNYNGTGYYYLLGDSGNYDPYPLNESVVF
ncbi:MAG: hypothetical protein KAR08_08295 [Candidatus Heimdallarchaeota archaeon]|nr:hypothetical protein [Candidatus Heimdallarchaeota archaeon]